MTAERVTQIMSSERAGRYEARTYSKLIFEEDELGSKPSGSDYAVSSGFKADSPTLPTVHLIPTPGGERTRPPRYEPLVLRPWVVFGLCASMCALAISLEVGLHFSNKQQGFGLRPYNALGFITPSFALSFFPILLVLPFVRLWMATDWAVQWWQPYVMLSKGNALVEDSVLLDYMAMNKIHAFFHAFTRRHWLVAMSVILALASNLVQPLAGSVFNIDTFSMRSPTQYTLQTGLGIASDVGTLQTFSAASGFVDAATLQGLSDPPYVKGGWTVASFLYQGTQSTASNRNFALNASLNLVGILSQPNCQLPASSHLDTSNPSAYHVSVSRPDGCSVNATINPHDSDQQYGVVPVDARSCGISQGASVAFSPLVFWYFHLNAQSGQNVPEVGAVFCNATIEVWNVEATIDLYNGSVLDVSPLTKYVNSTNNVTGPPLDGRAYNGLIFDQSNDTFVQARALSIQNGVPGSVFRFAQQSGSLESYFTQPGSFLNATADIYTQFLAVSAKAVYFVPGVRPTQGYLAAPVQRLVIDPFPAHCLSALFLAIAAAGALVHWLHWRGRAGLYLTAPPGSIAASTALAYHSGMGERLSPYDDEGSMRRKLGKLHYGLDGRTGAIVASDRDDADAYEMNESGQDIDRKSLLRAYR